MGAISFFESIGCQSDVVFVVSARGGNSTLVDKVGSLTLTSKHAVDRAAPTVAARVCFKILYTPLIEDTSNLLYMI